MINITQQPNTPISAFNDSIYVMETSASDAIKGSVLSGSTILGSQYAVRIGGVFTFNFKGLLSTILNKYNNPLLTSTSLNTLTTSNKVLTTIPLTIEFEEVIETPDTETISEIIHRSSNNNRSYWNTSQNAFIANYSGDRYIFKNSIIPITIIGKNQSHTLNINGSGNSITLTNHLNNYTYRTNNDKLTLNINNQTINYYLINKPQRGKTIYWLNEFGGWEQFIFIDYDERQIINKENFYTYKEPGYTQREYATNIDTSYTELKLYSYPTDGRRFTYLKSLMYSPIILDEDGNRLELVTGNLLTDLNDIHTPDISVRYLNQNIMNF